jgi:hypothetical protein
MSDVHQHAGAVGHTGDALEAVWAVRRTRLAKSADLVEPTGEAPQPHLVKAARINQLSEKREIEEDIGVRPQEDVLSGRASGFCSAWTHHGGARFPFLHGLERSPGAWRPLGSDRQR